MDVLKTPLVILFKNQNPYRILANYFHNYTSKESMHNIIDEKKFVDLCQEEDNQYSKDDWENVRSIVVQEMDREESGIGENSSVFNLLINYSERVLENCGDAVRCKYKELIKWRDISLKLDQDLFICSFIASQDIFMRNDRRFFDWDTIIKSNNIRLHNTLSKGMSDNHFHLKGSAPTFKLSWISLMNDIDCRKLDTKSDMENRLDKDIDGQLLIEDSIVIAAILRIILFRQLNKEVLNNDKETNKIISILKQIISYDGCNNREYLIDKEMISLYSNELKNEINSLKYLFGKELMHKGRNVKVDYAITKNLNTEDKGTQLFIGERAFMYNCFKKIYSNNEEFLEKADLFYSYLILKNKIRAELVQQNKRVGFSNFSDYQGRKCIYLRRGTALYDSVEPLAVLTSIKNQNLKSLEARVIPKKSVYDNVTGLRDCDKRIDEYIYADKENYWTRSIKDTELFFSRGDSEGEQKIILDSQSVQKISAIKQGFENKYFYVYHFPKKVDDQLEKDELYKSIRCRHYSYRKELKEYSQQIAALRENFQTAASRVLGIDACSNELVTRPEVFGQAFRFLKGHLPICEYKREFHDGRSLAKLRATYHVGEDFLDVIDGLRAIDEAIEFLELTHGDRVGHAIVLGIDIKEWYSKKANRVYLTKQDLLDNIAWLISKIKNFNIEAGPDSIDKLISIYNKYYVEIYTEKVEYNKLQNDINYMSKTSVVPVDTYINAWKLRGNDPEAYFDLDKEKTSIGYWDRCALKNKEDNYLIKNLYHRYHYDTVVKDEGNKKVAFKVEEYMIDIIVEVQKCMQIFVRERGIGIETNPSSNVLISNFKRYDKHPILNMYNIGIEKENEQEKPQLFVSINTDDQGVFDTLLENEYALMAIALEKVKDAKGQPLYNQSQIYDWINRVREMGIEQSFRIINGK